MASLGQIYNLTVDASQSGRPIPPNLFGIFFEEINHAGAGGLWAELVANRGFEAGGQSTPSNIAPWSVIGDAASVQLSTERISLFALNPVALRVDVLCSKCPAGGVGVYNPGYWGMNIIAGSQYKVVCWALSLDDRNISISFTSSDGSRTLAQQYVSLEAASSSQTWNKLEILLNPSDTDHYGRLSITATQAGVFWLDQVSAMPLDTYKGHGFRNDLVLMLQDLKPRFLRFPGGCFVEGQWLRNAFRWRQSIGPWEERPGHFGDVWGYWTDDGLGFFEFFLLAEDLKATPIWVFNNGISHTDEVSSSVIQPFVQDVMNGIEFARGPANSTWGSIRASMGHPEPFSLEYVAIGNEDCGKQYYHDNYIKFYEAINDTYPDIGIISNCDGSYRRLDHPADMYDFHIYTSANRLFAMNHQFDSTLRSGPKAFVSEYAVTGKDAGKGSFYAALAEASFLIGIETNSDVVEMASYAPLFVNDNDRRWNPDAIVFDAWQSYGTPSYWVQTLFKNSSGSSLLPSIITGKDSASNILAASALRRFDDDNGLEFLDIKIVNFGKTDVLVTLQIFGLLANEINQEAAISRLMSENIMDENTFSQQQKVVPKMETLQGAGANMDMKIPALSFNVLECQLITPLHQLMFSQSNSRG
ncbi:hypothetical protein GOP47_0019640 [Adiantum capillus-veneris]|uniref:non-reducing end alpha-L-arabinofuranosidase n=1 Tax=Adiantum capillus-veneris TaxID=13818 RepID=A0A9D4Z8N5_ADICA|nr:hypothetical protein GOP47_0019640 [Adiantum capillus-veneris]